MESASDQSRPNFDLVFHQLFAWCRERQFAGFDPFDALNSRLFQSTPLAQSPTARLLWTQFLKRSPIDLRPLTGVPQQRNAKGMALFSLAALADHRRQQTKETENEVRRSLASLIDMRLSGLSGAAWGYNFDWQSRHFFAPVGTAAIVPTAFAARALIEAAQVFPDREYSQFARSACDFILKDLPVTEDEAGAICFGYTPTAATCVFNASLLAAETLAAVAELSGEEFLLNRAKLAVTYVIKRQQADGSWTYGTDPTQSWIDSFHTAFLLYSLAKIIPICHLPEYEAALHNGYKFWRERFFLADGWPKYYDHKLYPADTHAAASAIITLLEFQKFDPGALALAEKICEWAIKNLRDSAGYFYYQQRRWFVVKTPFMRWSQAWMLYGLGRLIEEKTKQIPVQE